MSGEHTVVKDEYLSKIATDHGVTLGELLAANPQFTSNGRTPNLIYPDEIVKIPLKSFTGTGSGPCGPCAPKKAPEIVSDGANLITGSAAYKNCPEAVKSAIGSKDFTADEKKAVDEVLGKYEKLMKCKNHPLKKIGRTDKAITKNGACVAEKSTMGEWFAEQGALVITDNASTPVDFTDPDTQFKGTIAHEFSHALMNNFDPRDCKSYNSYHKNPLMKEYKKIAGWDATGQTLTETATDSVPTTYGENNPKEDMAESAMLYLYDPDELKSKSPKRYKFMKDIFGDT